MMGRMALPYHGASFLSQGWQANRLAQARHYTGWVYVAVRALAKLVAEQRPILSVVRQAKFDQQKKRFTYKYIDRRAREKSLASVNPNEDLEPLDQEHPLYHLFAHPNPDDTAADIWYETALFLELTGSAYWWLPKNGWGLPAEIWVLPSHWVFPAATGDERVINEYEVRPIYGGFGIYRFPADEILHFRFKSPISKVDGFSPMTAGAAWIDQSESIDAARFASFKNGSVPGLSLELPPEYVDPTNEDIERIEQKFINKFSGETKYGRPIILSPGMKLTPLTISPREMDFTASAEQIRDYVLALFGVSKTIVGITEEVNFASMIAAQAGMCRFAVDPLVSMIDDTITKKLASRYDRKIRVWHKSCAPADPQQTLAENQTYLAAGVKTINEVREDLGLEPYANGGDDPILPNGSTPLPLNSGEDIDWSAILQAAQVAAGQKPGAAQPGAMPGQPPQQPEQQDVSDGKEESAPPVLDDEPVIDTTGIPNRLTTALRNGHAHKGSR